MLRCVLTLVAVRVSSLCAAGPSAAESVRAEPASTAADALPAAGLPVGRAGAARAGADLREAAALHEAVDPSSSGTGHCDGQGTSDTAARDGSRPSAPLPTPEREEHRAQAATTGPAPAGPGSAPLAPDPVQLSVLRI